MKQQSSHLRREYRVWDSSEEQALRDGVKKHGLGAWEKIRTDPEFGALRARSGVQLKDKWRNLVKFRHLSQDDAQSLHPKTSGPWHRRHALAAAANGGLPLLVAPRPLPRDPSSGSLDDATVACADQQQAQDEWPTGDVAPVRKSARRAAAARCRTYRDLAALSGSDAEGEDGRGEGDDDEDSGMGGGGVSSGSEGCDAALAQRKRRRSNESAREDRRFGIYDRRRYDHATADPANARGARSARKWVARSASTGATHCATAGAASAFVSMQGAGSGILLMPPQISAEGGTESEGSGAASERTTTTVGGILTASFAGGSGGAFDTRRTAAAAAAPWRCAAASSGEDGDDERATVPASAGAARTAAVAAAAATPTRVVPPARATRRAAPSLLAGLGDQQLLGRQWQQWRDEAPVAAVEATPAAVAGAAYRRSSSPALPGSLELPSAWELAAAAGFPACNWQEAKGAAAAVAAAAPAPVAAVGLVNSCSGTGPLCDLPVTYEDPFGCLEEGSGSGGAWVGGDLEGALISCEEYLPGQGPAGEEAAAQLHSGDGDGEDYVVPVVAEPQEMMICPYPGRQSATGNEWYDNLMSGRREGDGCGCRGRRCDGGRAGGQDDGGSEDDTSTGAGTEISGGAEFGAATAAGVGGAPGAAAAGCCSLPLPIAPATQGSGPFTTSEATAADGRGGAGHLMLKKPERYGQTLVNAATTCVADQPLPAVKTEPGICGDGAPVATTAAAPVKQEARQQMRLLKRVAAVRSSSPGIAAATAAASAVATAAVTSAEEPAALQAPAQAMQMKQAPCVQQVQRAPCLQQVQQVQLMQQAPVAMTAVAFQPIAFQGYGMMEPQICWPMVQVPMANGTVLVPAELPAGTMAGCAQWGVAAYY